MNYSLDVIIQCPFFVKESKDTLCCEGYVTGTCMTTSFSTKNHKLRYIYSHCIKVDGGSCYLARSLFEKYKRIHEAEDKKELAERKNSVHLMSVK